MGPSVKKKCIFFIFKQATVFTAINVSMSKNNSNLKLYLHFSFNSIN